MTSFLKSWMYETKWLPIAGTLFAAFLFSTSSWLTSVSFCIAFKLIVLFSFICRIACPQFPIRTSAGFSPPQVSYRRPISVSKNPGPTILATSREYFSRSYVEAHRALTHSSITLTGSIVRFARSLPAGYCSISGSQLFRNNSNSYWRVIMKP